MAVRQWHVPYNYLVHTYLPREFVHRAAYLPRHDTVITLQCVDKPSTSHTMHRHDSRQLIPLITDRYTTPQISNSSIGITLEDDGADIEQSQPVKIKRF